MQQSFSSDLIYEILSHFLPCPKLSTERLEDFPWYLGQICSAWRTVFICCSPQFWSTLTVDLEDRFTAGRLERALAVTKMSVERSKGYPLSFSVSIHYDFMCRKHPDLKRTFCHEIVETLIAHSARWRDAHFVLAFCTFVPIRRALKNHLPFLRSLKLNESSVTGCFCDAACPKDLVLDAPQLTRISLGYCSWKFNWSTITVAHLTYIPTLDDFLSNIRQAIRLEELVIECVLKEISREKISPVHLPFLRVLYVEVPDTVLLFDAPDLDELYIRNDIARRGSTISHVANEYLPLLHRLRKFSFYAISIPDGCSFIRKIPTSVEDVLLHGEMAIHVHTILVREPRFVNLRTLSLGIKERDTFSLNNMLTTVEALHGNIRGISALANLARLSLEVCTDGTYALVNEKLESVQGVLRRRGMECIINRLPSDQWRAVGKPSFQL